MRWIILALALASPAAADVPDRQTLEEPGRIWLRETLPLGADNGVVVPFLSYVAFQDETFRDMMATMAFVIAPDSCEEPWRCGEARRSGAIFTGQYQITDDGLTLSDITRSPLNFERAESALVMNADSFTRGESSFALSMADGTLIRQSPGGELRYLPAQEQHIDEILGIAYSLSVAITDNYTCLVEGHLARTQSDTPDKLSVSLIALAKYGAMDMQSRDAMHNLSRGETVMIPDLPENEQAELRQLQTQVFLLRMIFSEMLANYAESQESGGDLSLPNLPNIDDVIPEGILDRFSADVRQQIMTNLEADLEIARQAVPAFHAHSSLAERSETITDLLCHGL